MISEDQLMSVDSKSTPTKMGIDSLNSSASSTLSFDAKPTLNTWAEEVLRAEQPGRNEKSRASSSLNSSRGSPKATVTNNDFSKQEREIALEFIDDANEEKFDRLIKQEKIKTPFKRRHSQTPSNDSRSNSPNSSSNSEADSNDRKKSQFKSHKEEKRLRHNSHTSSTSSSSYIETDPAVISRRQKQIDYGKNTLAYERYTEMVPKSKRTRDHPRTPNIHGKYSRRAFDGLIKIWRKQLHFYDPPTVTEQGGDNSDSDSDSD